MVIFVVIFVVKDDVLRLVKKPFLGDYCTCSTFARYELLSKISSSLSRTVSSQSGRMRRKRVFLSGSITNLTPACFSLMSRMICLIAGSLILLAF